MFGQEEERNIGERRRARGSGESVLPRTGSQIAGQWPLLLVWRRLCCSMGGAAAGEAEDDEGKTPTYTALAPVADMAEGRWG